MATWDGANKVILAACGKSEGQGISRIYSQNHSGKGEASNIQC